MDATGTEGLDRGALMREVRSYLRAVEIFRTEGHEPHWQVEQHVPRTAPPRTPDLHLRVCDAFSRLDPG
jgi:hypothetical protein